MNLLDKAINIVSPRTALQRARSRVALELTTGYLERHAQRFRYDGATAGRRAHGWYAASTDANVELMGSLIWLRNRSRDLIRNKATDWEPFEISPCTVPADFNTCFLSAVRATSPQKEKPAMEETRSEERHVGKE